jgi:DNA-binding NarL/FixJ family response regulator
VRLLLVDDHPVVRTGLRALIATLEGLEVVGEAVDGESAVTEAVRLGPDVVLMDVRMDGIGGVEATRRLATAVPGAAVLVLTMYDDDATVFTAMQAGARGYLLKGADQEEIRTAVLAVAAGQAVFGPAVAARLLAMFADVPAPVHDVGVPQGERGPALPDLTAREREILDLLASGMRTQAIADRLYLSPKTVSNNLTTIFAKLEVADRTAAVIRARESGLGGERP